MFTVDTDEENVFYTTYARKESEACLLAAKMLEDTIVNAQNKARELDNYSLIQMAVGDSFNIAALIEAARVLKQIGTYSQLKVILEKNQF